MVVVESVKKASPGTWGGGGNREQPLFVPSFAKTRIGQNFEHQGHKLQDSYFSNVYVIYSLCHNVLIHVGEAKFDPYPNGAFCL